MTTGLLAIWAVLVMGGADVLRAQDQQYRERQVFDPESGEWVDQAPPSEAEPEDILGQARAQLAKGHAGAALGPLKKWLKSNRDDEHYYDAEFLLGDCYFLDRDFWKAVERYQDVAENTGGQLFDRANERCVDVARAFLSGQKRILWMIFRIPAYDEGVEILDRVWERVPGTRLGELALKLKADFYYERGDMNLAQDEYANLSQQYPSGRWVQFAMLRSAQAADAAFPGIRFDDQPLIEADARYRQVLAAFPGYAEREQVSQRLVGIREQRAAKDLDIARWYERTRRSDAALFYYEQILKDWPDTLAASQAQTRLRAMKTPVVPPLETGPVQSDETPEAEPPPETDQPSDTEAAPQPATEQPPTTPEPTPEPASETEAAPAPAPASQPAPAQEPQP